MEGTQLRVRSIYFFSVLLLLSFSFKQLVTKAQSPNYVGDDCQNTTQKPVSSAYKTNLNSVLSWLSSDAATSKGYGHNSFGSNSHTTPSGDAVYVLYDCRSDVVGYFCQFCVSTATREVLQRCPNGVSAIIWYDFCILRYSSENFFGNLTVYPSWHAVGKENVSDSAETQKGEDFMRSLIRKATKETNQLYYMDSFNLSSTQRRYGLVQCSRDLTNEGQASSVPLPNPQTAKQGSTIKSKILIIGLSVLGSVALLCFSVYCFWFRNRARKDGRIPHTVRLSSYHNVQTEGTLNPDLPTIPLITILQSTNDFSEACKLGEGGFGPVYKGILPDGRQISIKRLSKASGQGSEEFKNEVMFIAKLQHRNLVRLLACCLEEDEKILVYEYMSNSSLDFHLFVKSDVFSFGVLVLEIICGEKNSGFYLSECGRSLILYAWTMWCAGKCLELMDPVLEKSYIASEVDKCVHIGLLCVQEDAADRPTMSNVIVILASETVALPKPNQPAFSVGRMTLDEASTSKSSKNLSINDVTVSNIIPR
ncbi:hypothetical protein RJT34_01569 [Clitoria ternatea]|uniref:non-specific serine/threonine protein kinase n=1 Tax=Clitoria ternatea TaxID=43366 RepID=A0AAN9KJN3_CLITE